MSPSHVGEQVRLWQECPHTSPLLCSMDPDHPPLVWVARSSRGFLECLEETCGFIRYDVNPQVVYMVHRERHHGCYYREDVPL